MEIFHNKSFSLVPSLWKEGILWQETDSCCEVCLEKQMFVHFRDTETDWNGLNQRKVE